MPTVCVKLDGGRHNEIVISHPDAEAIAEESAPPRSTSGARHVLAPSLPHRKMMPGLTAAAAPPAGPAAHGRYGSTWSASTRAS